MSKIFLINCWYEYKGYDPQIDGLAMNPFQIEAKNMEDALSQVCGVWNEYKQSKTSKRDYKLVAVRVEDLE